MFPAPLNLENFNFGNHCFFNETRKVLTISAIHQNLKETAASILEIPVDQKRKTFLAL
jgi:hypothetical protein